MSFVELDEARQTAATASASGKREKKRKTATIARLNPEVVSGTIDNESGQSDDLRTGRWTQDEMAYCDMLISKFETGELPVADGTKLNDFLANMLKSKQSRLTKKMKNAKLSARAFKRVSGYLVNTQDARVFSELENAFYRSITCSMERAEIRFHLQKEWRELFSAFCVQLGQKLEADDWLSSVEEMDRRASRAKDAAKMARRKRMMGYALEQDSMNPPQGVFIDAGKSSSSVTDAVTSESEENLLAQRQKRQRGPTGTVVVRKPVRVQPPPFLGRLIHYMQRHSVPFEYLDAWVPSFVNGGGPDAPPGAAPQQKCRLCFAGCGTSEVQVAHDGRGMVPLAKEDQFDLTAFGEYSQKFSFDVGCGLPGRVYHTGVPSWEQHVQNAPVGHFERSGGAVQWGIKTVLGIPVPSPNVGRIVVLFYSRHDRPQSQEMVARIVEEMTKLMPSPKWKLVVDVGAAPQPPPAAEGSAENPEKAPKQEMPTPSPPSGPDGLLKLLTELMPTTTASPLAPYLPGFTSLRMMLLKPIKTQQDSDLVNCMVQSFTSYMATGRPLPDIAVLVVRDYLALSQKQPVHQQPVHQTVLAPAAPAYAPVAQQQQQQAFHAHQLHQQHLQQQLQQHYQPVAQQQQQVVGVQQQHQVVGVPQQQHQQHQQQVVGVPQHQQQQVVGVPQQQQQQQQVVGVPQQGIDFGNVGGLSVEPTPVSQLRAMTGMAQAATAPQYQQVSAAAANGPNPQFVVFNPASIK